jgi:hypothetical protein
MSLLEAYLALGATQSPHIDVTGLAYFWGEASASATARIKVFELKGPFYDLIVFI